MFVMFTFKVQIGDKIVEGPCMGAGDIELLKKHFPNNPIWECRKSDLGNQMFPTIQEMTFLYNDLLRYFAKKTVSIEQFQTGNFGGSFAVVSTERSLFQHLIEFCEKELGFKRLEELKATIARKEAQYLREEKNAKAGLKRQVLSVFCKLPFLKKPKDSVLVHKLQLKLIEYNLRLARTSRHPSLAFSLEPKYRDVTYKIEVLSALLTLKDGGRLSLKEMALKAMDLREKYFYPDEYYNACAVIARYIGKPFKGSDIRRELLQVVQG